MIPTLPPCACAVNNIQNPPNLTFVGLLSISKPAQVLPVMAEKNWQHLTCRFGVGAEHTDRQTETLLYTYRYIAICSVVDIFTHNLPACSNLHSNRFSNSWLLMLSLGYVVVLRPVLCGSPGYKRTWSILIGLRQQCGSATRSAFHGNNCYLDPDEAFVAALAPDECVVAVPMLSCENALWLDSMLDIDPL